jgi:hypothetical protein
MPNRFIPLQEGVSDSQKTAVINNNFAQLDGETYTRIYNNAQGVPTIIIGLLPDGTTGIVVAKEGENVLDVFA